MPLKISRHGTETLRPDGQGGQSLRNTQPSKRNEPHFKPLGAQHEYKILWIEIQMHTCFLDIM
jgi:hypothetical protein